MRDTTSLVAGLEALKRSKLLVLMLARDCAESLEPNLARVHELMQVAAEGSCCLVYENDSKDPTKAQLKRACRVLPWLSVVSRDVGAPRYPSVRSASRGHVMAYYRNECRARGLELLPDPDLVMVMDPDVAWFSTDGVLNSLAQASRWTACASTGLRWERTEWVQVDAWAYRQFTWEPMMFREVRKKFGAVGCPLVQVKSAFGGLCLYHGQPYAAPGSVYEGGDCEHVSLHRARFPEGFRVNPSQVVVYKW